MEDNDFEFNHCPECGSTDLTWPIKFASMGRIKLCRCCGKKWHVIFENPEEFEEEEESA